MIFLIFVTALLTFGSVTFIREAWNLPLWQLAIVSWAFGPVLVLTLVAWVFLLSALAERLA